MRARWSSAACASSARAGVVIACAPMRDPSARRRCVVAWALGAWLVGAAPPALAQGRMPDATDFALGWGRGGFASPVVCRFPDGAKRGLRRVVIAPGPPTSEERVDRMQFFDLAADGAERCTDELGGDAPNLGG